MMIKKKNGNKNKPNPLSPLVDLSSEDEIKQIPKPTETVKTTQNVNNIFGQTDETAIFNNPTKNDKIDLANSDDDLFGDF